MKITNRGSRSTLNELNSGNGSRNASVQNSVSHSHTISARDGGPIHLLTHSTHRAEPNAPPHFND